MAENPFAACFDQLPQMQRRWQQTKRQLAFDCPDLKAYRGWQRRLTRKLCSLTGYNTMERCDPRPTITEEREFPGYLRQRLEIHTEPQVVMPVYVLIPTVGQAPYPAVLAPHGHGSGGKLSPAGCAEIPAIAGAIEQYNYDYGVQLARAGMIAFCPDARGFGERQLPPARHDILLSSCQWLNNMGYPLGQTVTGMWAWDLHRLIDYVQTRSDVIADRIGCAGLSGGGLQTLWATALDARISCAVISGYLYGYREALLERYSNCSCNYVPHLYEQADMGDIAALIAPRPLLIETGDADPLNGASGLQNVKSQLRITRRAYRLFDALPNLRHHVFAGGHRWHGGQAVPWLKKHLDA